MTMNDRSTASLLALIFLLASCGGGSAPAPAPPPTSTPPPSPPPAPPPSGTASVERDIDPLLTTAGITSNFSPHVAINPAPSVTARGRLFVMLPGTGAIPRFYRFILRAGTPRGYHAIGLTYPNDTAVGTLCAGSSVADCAGLVRNEIITGADTSPLVSVNPANSITGRLISLLTYLSTTFPNEGWGQYLTGGQPNWSLITVAGHSQGAGHAGFLAKLQSLDRAVMFSGTGDTGQAPGSAAVWLSRPNVTPASRQYGFTHTADNLIPLSLVTRNWGVIGLDAFGAPVSVDSVASPYGNARQLTTSAPPNPATPATVESATHSSPVVDVATPLTAQGQLAYLPVWTYLAFP